MVLVEGSFGWWITWFPFNNSCLLGSYITTFFLTYCYSPEGVNVDPEDDLSTDLDPTLGLYPRFGWVSLTLTYLDGSATLYSSWTYLGWALSLITGISLW